MHCRTLQIWENQRKTIPAITTKVLAKWTLLCPSISSFRSQCCPRLVIVCFFNGLWFKNRVIIEQLFLTFPRLFLTVFLAIFDSSMAIFDVFFGYFWRFPGYLWRFFRLFLTVVRLILMFPRLFLTFFSAIFDVFGLFLTFPRLFLTFFGHLWRFSRLAETCI